MRIVIDVRTISDHFPGMGRYTYHLVCSLAQQLGPDKLILLSNTALANTRFDIGPIASYPNVRIVATDAKPLSFSEQWRLPRELRRLMPGVMHFPQPIIPFAAPRPVVTNIYDIIPIRLPQYFSVKQRILYRASLSLALRSAKRIICLSQATLADIKAAFYVDSSRLCAIPAGIDEVFRPATETEVERVRSGYQLPETYLLYVGSNKPHKNLPALIDAYASMHSAPHLVLAGEEDARYPQARRRAESLGLADRVRVLGAVGEKDLPALYSGALAFIFPSTYEGFGFPPLEAMACGVPVACSNIACLQETAGDAALQFDPEDAASMARAMNRLIADGKLRADLRDRGLRRAAEFSWDHAARQTLDLYHYLA
jgi:glycosyltransferase involved in cell wall biosynthesis